jgi:hypothetical protein
LREERVAGELIYNLGQPESQYENAGLRAFIASCSPHLRLCRFMGYALQFKISRTAGDKADSK